MTTLEKAARMALEAQVENILEQAQVFASAWALVGGRFDGGNAMDDAEVAKNNLRQMVLEALAEQLHAIDHIADVSNMIDQPKKEPVAWHYQSRLGNDYLTDVKAEPSPDWRETPLYTELAKREWVGLTDEEIQQGNKQSWVTQQAFESAVWWAEQKLKEKNGV
jgi:hypothetical protein